WRSRLVMSGSPKRRLVPRGGWSSFVRRGARATSGGVHSRAFRSHARSRSTSAFRRASPRAPRVPLADGEASLPSTRRSKSGNRGTRSLSTFAGTRTLPLPPGPRRRSRPGGLDLLVLGHAPARGHLAAAGSVAALLLGVGPLDLAVVEADLLQRLRLG